MIKNRFENNIKRINRIININTYRKGYKMKILQRGLKKEEIAQAKRYMRWYRVIDNEMRLFVNLGLVTDKGELLFAMLNREIDWVRTDGEKNQTNYYRNIDDMKIVDEISNIKIEGRECVTTEECDESEYWIEWTGNGSPGVTVLKFEVEWRYNEYEYAE